MSAVARAGPGEGKAPYKRHEPETSALYKIVSDNLESFLRYTREHYRKPLPRYVEREFRRFIRCGILSFGLTRLRCARCGKDMLVAHSCKGRGICCSCTGRRMAATALHIVRNVLPPCPVRQWVLVVPFPMRRLLAADAKLFGAVVKIFVRVLDRFYRERAMAAGIESPKTGMLSFQQRFGGSLNAHCHVHNVVVDGVFSLANGSDKPRFHFVPAPSTDEIRSVAAAVAARVTTMLRRRGLLREPTHEPNEAEPIDDALDACRAVGHGAGRFERIDSRGRSQQELFVDLEVRSRRRKSSPWAAQVDGFSVEAGVHFGPLDTKGRETLVRYCLRPAISAERLSILGDGSIALRCKYTIGGKTHRVMQPLEFVARLAAIVPPPRFAMWRYHGVLAPASPWRSQIVPRGEAIQSCSHALDAKPQAACNKRDKPKTEGKPVGDPTLIQTGSCNDEPSSNRSWRPCTSYIPWPELLRHCLER